MDDISKDVNERENQIDPFILSMNKKQYKCIVKLLHTTQYSCQPLYWQMEQTLPSWSELLSDTEQEFVWPLCYNWPGALRMGLMKYGVDTNGELYRFIHKSLPSLVSTRASRSRLTHPLTYLMFTHIGRAKFRLSFHRNLFKKGQIGIVKNSPSTNSVHKLKARFANLNQVRTVSLPSKMSKRKAIHTMFEERIGLNDDRHIQKLEGFTSSGFHLELEKLFCLFARQMEKNGKKVDYDHIQSFLYKDDSSWQLNSVALNRIGKSLNEYIVRQLRKIKRKHN